MWVGGWGGWVGGYDQLCCPAGPKLLLGLDLGQGCDKSSAANTLDLAVDLKETDCVDNIFN